MEMGNRFNVFLPANTASILKPTNQGVLFTFMSYYLRNTFQKAKYSVVIPLGKVNGKPLEKDSQV